MMSPLPAINRERFPIFAQKNYLNSCSQGALSVDVQQAYQTFLSDWQEQGSPWDVWVEHNEGLRQQLASFINASVNEIAVTTSVSAGVGTLATALKFDGSRRKIIVDDFAFPTTAQIWHAQKSRGAEIVHVAAVDDHIPTEHFEAAIDEETLLVNLTHVCYRNGVKIDVPKVVEIAHQRGALVLLDSFQAVGTMPIDVRVLDVDFLVGGMLKYLCGSAGVAFLYAREQLIEQLYPTDVGWFAQDDIFAMDIYDHTPSKSARRFESGTPPVPSLYAARSGLALVDQIGCDLIQTHVRQLAAQLKSAAHTNGYRLVSPQDPKQHGAMITIRSLDVERLVAQLGQDNIIVSSRDGNLRVSPHFYNSSADIDQLIERLDVYSYLVEKQSS